MSDKQIIIRLIIYVIGYALKVAVAIAAILVGLWMICSLVEIAAAILTPTAVIILFIIMLAVMFFIACS